MAYLHSVGIKWISAVIVVFAPDWRYINRRDCMVQQTARRTFADNFDSARDWWHLALIAGALLPVVAAACVVSGNAGSAVFWRRPGGSLPVHPTREGAVQELPLTAPAHTTWKTIRIGAGETFADVLAKTGIAPRTRTSILKLGRPLAKTSWLSPGRILEVRRDGAGRVIELRYDLDALSYLDIVREGKRFEKQIVRRPNSGRFQFAAGEIESSLSQAARHAGLNTALTVKLTHLFRERIDFRHQTQPGDTFEVVYDEGAGPHGTSHGRILAAEVNVNGQRHQVFWFAGDGRSGQYYTADGKLLRGSFSRAPLHYKRISSHFSYHRMNPVLHIVRPHYGVDYAAPMGTPVKAAANGKIIFCGRGGGYGRLIVVRSFKHYKTYYAHLHGFAKGLSAGDWVHRGQVIGYVGESGIATGPHLHFGIQVDGVWKNPLTVPLPEARPLPQSALAEFRRRIGPFIAALDTQETAATHMVAAAASDDDSGATKGF
jgi:murein DD-endopeptidase MepM/ murein hydrolase activator NlpD